MKYIAFVFAFLLVSINSFAQPNLDELNDKGIELYREGDEQAALKLWKQVLKLEPDSTRHYGMAANNILFKYFEDGNIPKASKYFNLIVNSNLRDDDKNPDLMEPYANYRHHAAMRMASLYAKKGKYHLALEHVYKADTLYDYVTFSLTSYIYKKVDMAFWKFRLYKDLGNMEMAKYVMIERGLNNDYNNQFPDWHTASISNDEIELADTLFKQYSAAELKELKSDMDSAFSSLELIQYRGQKTAVFELNGLVHRIPIYTDIDKDGCITMFRNTVLYDRLTELTSN